MRTVWGGLMAVAFIALSVPAWADGGKGTSAPIPDAEVLIEACFKASREKIDNGSHERMIEGSKEVVACLRGHILENAQALIGEEQIEDAANDLDALIDSMLSFYLTVYSDVDVCYPTCGRMYELFPYGIAFDRLKDMLRRVIKQREEYKDW